MSYLVYKTLTNARFERVHGKQILEFELLICRFWWKVLAFVPRLNLKYIFINSLNYEIV